MVYGELMAFYGLSCFCFTHLKGEEKPSAVKILAIFGLLEVRQALIRVVDGGSARALDMSSDITIGHLSDMSMTNVYDKCP